MHQFSSSYSSHSHLAASPSSSKHQRLYLQRHLCVGCCNSSPDMLFFYYSEIDHWMIAVWSIAALSLIVICACYVAIRAKLSSSRLVSVASKDNSLEQNKKLSRTLYIVIGASLVCWGSSSVAHFIFHQCSGCFSKHVLYSFYIFHLANSLVNPVIYSFIF